VKGRRHSASPPGDFYVILQIALPHGQRDAAKAAYAANGCGLPFIPRKLGV